MDTDTMAMNILRYMVDDLTNSPNPNQELHMYKLDDIAQYHNITYQQVEFYRDYLNKEGYINLIDKVDDADLHIQRLEITGKGFQIVKGKGKTTMTINGLFPKLLYVIYQRTVGRANSDSLLTTVQTQDMLDELHIKFEDYSKILQYMCEKHYIKLRSPAIKKTDNGITIQPDGIDYVENNMMAK